MSTPPPRKRLKLNLSLDAHDWEHAERLLYDICTRIGMGDIRSTITSGAGFHLEVDEDPNAPGPDEYRRLLHEWVTSRRERQAEGD